MKIAVKFLKPIVLSIIILLVILCGVYYFFGEYILKIGIETAATKALNVSVDIDDTDLSILRGKIKISGLVIKNPSGYTYDNFLRLGYGQLKISVGSLLSNTIHIKELKLDGIDLTIEQKALTNNLHEIISAISSTDKPKPKSSTKGKKLHIDNLEITNITVTAKLLPIPGKVDTITFSLAPIRMSDLGTDNKLTTGALASKIVFAISQGVAEQGVGVLPENLINKVRLTLSKTIEMGKTVTQEGEKLIEAGKDVGTGLVEGFKGLLKPKKDE